MTYTEMPNGYIRRDGDNTFIPRIDGNLEYQDFLRWQASGGILQPYQSPAVDPKEQAKVELAASDKDMARIAEDLINIMVNNGLIKKEDLPNPVIAKLENRADLRKVLQADGD